MKNEMYKNEFETEIWFIKSFTFFLYAMSEEPSHKKSKSSSISSSSLTNVVQASKFPSIPSVEQLCQLLIATGMSNEQAQMMEICVSKLQNFQKIIDCSMKEFSLIRRDVNEFAASYVANTPISVENLVRLTIMANHVWEFSSYFDNINQLVCLLWTTVKKPSATSSSSASSVSTEIAVGFNKISNSSADMFVSMTECKIHQMMGVIAQFQKFNKTQKQIFGAMNLVINGPNMSEASSSSSSSSSNICIDFLKNWQSMVNLVQNITVLIGEAIEMTTVMLRAQTTTFAA